MNYVGKSHVNDNGVMAPDYMTFDLGYKHKNQNQFHTCYFDCYVL